MQIGSWRSDVISEVSKVTECWEIHRSGYIQSFRTKSDKLKLFDVVKGDFRGVHIKHLSHPASCNYLQPNFRRSWTLNIFEWFTTSYRKSPSSCQLFLSKKEGKEYLFTASHIRLNKSSKKSYFVMNLYKFLSILAFSQYLDSHDGTFFP